MAFGERLQEVRRRAGLTQEQFAAELKVSRQAVSKWEAGQTMPDLPKQMGVLPGISGDREDPLYLQPVSGVPG